MTRLQLVKAAERAGLKIEPFGEGEHRQIAGSVALMATGSIVAIGIGPDRGRELSIAEAAQRLGIGG